VVEILVELLSNIAAAVLAFIAVIIGYGVLAVWVISFFGQLIIPMYEPSNYVHLAMMAVVGSSFGISLMKGKGNDDI
jgi:hypothetical protein